MKVTKILKNLVSFSFVAVLALSLFLQLWFKSFHFSIDLSSFLYWWMLILTLWLNLGIKKIKLKELFLLAISTFVISAVLQLVFLNSIAESVLRLSLILWIYSVLGSAVNLVRKKSK